MIKLYAFLTITTTSSRFLQTDEATCLEQKLYYYSDAGCLPCGSQMHADETGKLCVSETCTDLKPYLNSEGYCINCEKSRFNSSTFSCMADSCSSNEVLTNDGYCQKCPEYQINKNGVCASPDCFSIQIVKPDGQCEECPRYTYPDQKKTSCIFD
jgi:hypothetical protein